MTSEEIPMRFRVELNEVRHKLCGFVQRVAKNAPKAAYLRFCFIELTR